MVNITFSSGSNGALPSGLTSSIDNFLLKTISQESSSYKLTLSSSYDGDTFNFTDNGIANFASDSNFAVRYSNSEVCLYTLNMIKLQMNGIFQTIQVTVVVL